jgi:hypothetical protein
VYVNLYTAIQFILYYVSVKYLGVRINDYDRRNRRNQVRFLLEMVEIYFLFHMLALKKAVGLIEFILNQFTGKRIDIYY